jgi:hypothetical protein
MSATQTATAREKMEKAYPPKPKTESTSKTNKKEDKKKDSSATSAKPFAFQGSFILNFDNENKFNHNNKGTIQYALNTYEAALVPTFSNMKDINDLRSILDINEKTSTLLTKDVKGKKSGLLMSMPKPVLAKDSSKKEKAPIITKTGKTKKIEPYKCEQINILFADSTIVSAWVTKDINIDFSEIIGLANMGFKGKSPFKLSRLTEVKGTVLEAVFTYKDGETMKLSLTGIKKEKPAAALFSTDGYKVSDVRGLPIFSGQ